MTIAFEQSGDSGPALALLHGWGLNHHVWSGITCHISDTHRVVAFDLPGHGDSDMPAGGSYGLREVAEAVASSMTQESIVLGWSLGGLIAQQIALLRPGLVKGLILVASSARFARGDDWAHGMDTDLLADFAAQLTQDYHATVQRFLALQSMGSRHARDEIRTLREAFNKVREPDPAALRGGLRLLQECDLRSQIKNIHCPVLIINGEKDRLVLPQAGKLMARVMPHAKHVMIKGAGHAPFLSHRDTFIELVERFTHGA